MKTIFFIILTGLSMASYGGTNPKKLNQQDSLMVKGFKAIRHDAWLRLDFRKVHEMNKEIKAEIK